MPTLDLAIIAIALSIDAFAVALAASAAGRVNGKRAAARLSFHFGLFQFLMPVLGWTAGATVKPLIESFDHWIAFMLLSIVGIRMIHGSHDPDGETYTKDPSRGVTLVALSTAVSIDALAVGLSLGMLNVRIWSTSIIIGCVTSAATLLGILLGNRMQERLGKIAELAGGIVLILVAIKIVIDHLSAP
jgi:manganese efflux pump family protein